MEEERKPPAVIISGELAETHAKFLKFVYDWNQQGVPLNGELAGNLLDVIRSLRGLPTEKEVFEKAWDGYTELNGVMLERYLARLLPSGQPIEAPVAR